jgi:hypothetical protein
MKIAATTEHATVLPVRCVNCRDRVSDLFEFTVLFQGFPDIEAPFELDIVYGSGCGSMALHAPSTKSIGSKGTGIESILTVMKENEAVQA